MKVHTMKKCCRWVTVEWEEATESWLVDIRFEAAPPESEWTRMAFGTLELKELHKMIGMALRSKKPKRKTP